MAETITWIAPSFLWEEALKDITKRERLDQPAIFRFDNDSFMEELADRLEKAPSSMKDLAARHETWIKKSSGWLTESESDKEVSILKLYQPTHGYFYIASAMLICRIPGFPDRKIDISNEEKASFVIRRLVPSNNTIAVDINNKETYIEYAMMAEGKGWRKASASSAASDEERLPLFPMQFTENNVKRRLLAGLIPVSKKEIYQSEPEFKTEAFPSENMDNEEKDELAAAKPAFLEFKNKIILACEKLTDYCNEVDADVKLAREILKNIVLDMDEYLEEYIGVVWKAIHDGWAGGIDVQKALYDKLGVEFASGKKWSEILEDKENLWKSIKDLDIKQIANSVSAFKDIDNFAGFLDIVEKALPDKKDPRILKFEKYAAKPFASLYTDISVNATITDEGARKSFLFILLDFAGFLNENLGNVFSAIIKNEDVGLDLIDKALYSVFRDTVFYGDFHWIDVLRELWDKRYAAISGKTDIRIISGASAINIKEAIRNLQIVDNNYSNSDIYTKIMNALNKNVIPSEPEAPQNIDKTAGALFFLRFVYDRPKCRNISESIVSEHTKPFQLANFYDPDAPARPLKITMPVDTSIEGLKKYPRNVAFIISDKLRNQMEMIKGAKIQEIDKVRPKGPAFNLGMVCSFSIPIITICALILLMIIVNLLNIIFWWLPYFKICFPLNLKAGRE